MPWRGPEFPGEFPSLGWLAAEWINENCAQPDRHNRGAQFELTDEQITHLVWKYRLHPNARSTPRNHRRRSPTPGTVLVRSQKHGKGPFSGADICFQAAGPALFAGWDANGEPVGMPWSTPLIQVTALERGPDRQRVARPRPHDRARQHRRRHP